MMFFHLQSKNKVIEIFERKLCWVMFDFLMDRLLKLNLAKFRFIVLSETHGFDQ
jgi:hypothetical protein